MALETAAELLAGLVVFTVGIALFVFPRTVADAVGEWLDRATGHRAMIAVRTAGLAAMATGVVLLLV